MSQGLTSAEHRGRCPGGRWCGSRPGGRGTAAGTDQLFLRARLRPCLRRLRVPGRRRSHLLPSLSPHGPRMTISPWSSAGTRAWHCPVNEMLSPLPPARPQPPSATGFRFALRLSGGRPSSCSIRTPWFKAPSVTLIKMSPVPVCTGRCTQMAEARSGGSPPGARRLPGHGWGTVRGARHPRADREPEKPARCWSGKP